MGFRLPRRFLCICLSHDRRLVLPIAGRSEAQLSPRCVGALCCRRGRRPYLPVLPDERSADEAFLTRSAGTKGIGSRSFIYQLAARELKQLSKLTSGGNRNA